MWLRNGFAVSFSQPQNAMDRSNRFVAKAIRMRNAPFPRHVRPLRNSLLFSHFALFPDGRRGATPSF